MLWRVTGNTTAGNLRLVVTFSYRKTGAYLVWNTQCHCYKCWFEGHLLLLLLLSSSSLSSSSSSQGLGFFSQYFVYIVFVLPCFFNGFNVLFLCICAVCVQYSRTPLTGINCDGEPSRYAENQDNWIFV